MKKTLRLLLSTTVLAALLAGMQITAFAAVTSSRMDVTSRYDESAAGRAATGRATETSEATSLDETNTTTNDTLNATSAADQGTDNTNQATANEINPISAANPRTGSGSLAIPAVVALLAASTAAVALSVKKR